MGLPALGAIITAAGGGAILPFVFISLAILTKYQAAVLLPLIVTIVFSRCGFIGVLKGIVAAAATTVAVYLPFILSGSLSKSFALTFGSAIGRHPLLTLHAHNTWWIISMLLGSIHISDSVKIFGIISAKVVGLALIAAFALVVTAGLSHILRHKGACRRAREVDAIRFRYSSQPRVFRAADRDARKLSLPGDPVWRASVRAFETIVDQLLCGLPRLDV